MSRPPQIDLKALLAQPNPHIDLKLQAYETSTRNFIKAVSNYKNRSIATIAERRATHIAETKRYAEKVKAVEDETKACKIKEIELAEGEQLLPLNIRISYTYRAGTRSRRPQRSRFSRGKPQAPIGNNK